MKNPNQFLAVEPIEPNWITLHHIVNWPDALEVEAIGDSGLLRSEKVGLFSSVRWPGDMILAAYDYVKKLRDTCTVVISGVKPPSKKNAFVFFCTSAWIAADNRLSRPVPGEHAHSQRMTIPY